MILAVKCKATAFYAVALHSMIITSIVMQFCLRRARLQLSRTCYLLLRGICPPYLREVLKGVCGLLRFRNYTVFVGRGTFVTFLRDHMILLPWRLAHILSFIIFISANIICTFVTAASLSEAGKRAGRLALVNAGSLYAGLHLGFLAHLIGVRRNTFRRVHSTISFTVLMLSSFHIAVALLDENRRFHLTTTYFFALLAAGFLAFQSVAFFLVRRWLWYELAIRLHQLGAGAVAYGLLRHVGNEQKIYAVIAGVYLILSTSAHLFELIYRNNWKFCTAQIKYDEHATIVNLCVNGRPAVIHAGQYVELWIPLSIERENFCGEPRISPTLLEWLFAGFRRLSRILSTLTFWQSHPFTVASWSSEPTHNFQFLILPRKGWTRRLHFVSKLHYFGKLIEKERIEKLEQKRVELGDSLGHVDIDLLNQVIDFLRRKVNSFPPYNTLALFSGPYGTVTNIRGYRRVLVVAEDLRIIRCIPYLRQLINEVKYSQNKNLERCHIIYETKRPSFEDTEIKDFFKELPLEDTDYTDAFWVTMYAPAEKQDARRRVQMFYGDMDVETVFSEQMALISGNKALVIAGLSKKNNCSMLRFLNKHLNDIDVIECDS